MFHLNIHTHTHTFFCSAQWKMKMNMPWKALKVVNRYAMMTVFSLMKRRPKAQVRPRRKSRVTAPRAQDLKETAVTPVAGFHTKHVSHVFHTYDHADFVVLRCDLQPNSVTTPIFHIRTKSFLVNIVITSEQWLTWCCPDGWSRVWGQTCCAPSCVTWPSGTPGSAGSQGKVRGHTERTCEWTRLVFFFTRRHVHPLKYVKLRVRQEAASCTYPEAR